MFNGLDLLSDESALTPTYSSVRPINNLFVKNAKYDEINIITRTDKDFSTEKEDWKYYNLLLAKFKENLNAGNVDFTGLMVDKISVKRRKAEDFEYQEMGRFDFDKDQIEYEFYDRWVASDQEYEYVVVPLTEDETEGNYVEGGKIRADFDNVFVLDKNNMFKLIYNVEYNNVEKNIPNETFAPIGSKYPIVIQNADTSYYSGDLNALVLSEATANSYKQEIDRNQEIRQRKALTEFLYNKKPKALKDGVGNMWLIACVGNPSISYLNELNRGLADISFSWVEIGNIEDVEDLESHGLL